jgi:hypothetical protein
LKKKKILFVFKGYTCRFISEAFASFSSIALRHNGPFVILTKNFIDLVYLSFMSQCKCVVLLGILVVWFYFNRPWPITQYYQALYNRILRLMGEIRQILKKEKILFVFKGYTCRFISEAFASFSSWFYFNRPWPITQYYQALYLYNLSRFTFLNKKNWRYQRGNQKLWMEGQQLRLPK